MRLEQAGREAEAAEEVLQQVQAQLAAAEVLRPQLKEAQEALEVSEVAHAAAMEAAAEAAAAEAAETMDDLLEAISHGRVDRAVWSAEVCLLEEAAAEAASQAAARTPYPVPRTPYPVPPPLTLPLTPTPKLNPIPGSAPCDTCKGRSGGRHRSPAAAAAGHAIAQP